MGYPARDSRVADEQLVQSIFGDVYDKKRLAPGQVTEARADVLLHDCSTLGGNSGSVLLDLATGRPLGCTSRAAFSRPTTRCPRRWWRSVSNRHGGRSRTAGLPAGRITIRFRLLPAVVTQTTDGGTPSEHEPMVEGVTEDYVGRAGYDTAFVGVDVPLPVVRNTSDVLTFPWNGSQEPS